MSSNRLLPALGVLLAMLLGAGLRFSSVDWGLPYLFHVDEKAFVVWEAMSTEWRGLTQDDWRPRSTSYGPLVFQTAIAVKWLTSGGSEAARAKAAESKDEQSYLRDAFNSDGSGGAYSWPSLFRALRTVSAVLGALSILFIALAGWRLESWRTGLVAAWLSAGCVGLAQVSHFYTADALLVFEVSVLCWLCAEIARRVTLLSVIGAGIACGTILATKLTGALVIPVVAFAVAANDPFAAHSSRSHELGRMFTRLAAALLSPHFVLASIFALGIYAVSCPWFFFDRATYFSVRGAQDGTRMFLGYLADREVDFYNWRFTYNDTSVSYWVVTVLPYAMGIPGTIACVLACLRSVVRLSVLDRIALATAVPALLFCLPLGAKPMRLLLPAVPGLLLVTASLLSQWTAPRPGRLLLKGMGAVVIGWTVLYAIAWTGTFRVADPRISAAHFVASRARPGDIVVTEPESSYTAPFGTNDDGIGQEPGFKPNLRIRRLWSTHPNDRGVAAHVTDIFREARFFITGDFYLLKAKHPSAPTRAPAQFAFYDALLRGKTGFRRIATFRPRPHLGPLNFALRSPEVLSVSFDRMGIEVWEKRRPFRYPTSND